MNEGPENIISAISQFAKKHGLVAPLEKGSTEEALCEYLREKIAEFFGPIRAQGKNWLLYEDGIWRLIEPDVFGSLVLDVIHPDNRSSRRADSLEAFLARRLRAETPRRKSPILASLTVSLRMRRRRRSFSGSLGLLLGHGQLGDGGGQK